MRFLLGLDTHWFLGLLNGSSSTNDHSGKYAEQQQFPGLARLKPGESMTFQENEAWLWTVTMSERINRFQELESHRGDLSYLATRLREYVDKWIESGYDPQECEEPFKRRLLPSPDLWNLGRFLKEHPIQLHTWDTGDLLVRFPPAPERGWEEYEADRLMFAFLDSDLRHSMAKCLRCGVYFQRSRLQPVYKRGAFCTDHTKVAGVVKQRSDENGDLLKRAADAWPKWTPKKHAIRETWVAIEMNGRAGSRGRRITRSWVTRNREKIQQAVADGTRAAK